MTAASPAERGSIRSPRRRASSDLGVVLARRGRHDDRVGVTEVGGVVAEVAGHAELAQRREEGRVVVVAAGDRDARAGP